MWRDTMDIFINSEILNKTKFNIILFYRNYNSFSTFLLGKNKGDERVLL